MLKALPRYFHTFSLLFLCFSCLLVTVLDPPYHQLLPMRERPNIVFILAYDLGKQISFKRNPSAAVLNVNKNSLCSKTCGIDQILSNLAAG